MKAVWAIGAGFVACLLLGTGCAGNALVEPSPTYTPAAMFTPLPTTTSLPVATPFPTLELPGEENIAPDFRFMLFQGEDVLGASEMALSQLEGRPLVLNFWARFCTPCWSEMPELQDFYEEYDDRVRLLGIDVGQFTGLGSHKDAGRLLDSLGITYPAGYTDDGRVVRDYQIRAMPTTAFITADGEVFRLWTGSITREEVTTIVRMMLEEEQ